MKDVAPHIEFAKRFLTTEVSTFDAYTAKARLETLVHEIAGLIPILNPVLEERFHPRFFEFVSYYKVGFVTCLEWHAKSRLYDLFSFDPSCISKNDIERGLSNSKLLQMVAEGLDIPHLLTSSGNIVTKDAYVGVFTRIFERLKITDAMSGILRHAGEDGATNGGILENLFQERNRLVHEISIVDVGHPVIRDFTALEDAVLLGKRIGSIMSDIELEISQNAPEGFPNLLDKEGFPIDEVYALQNRIAKFENQIGEELDKNVDFVGTAPGSWGASVSKSRDFVEAQLEFIGGLEMAGARYYDVRPYLRVNLLKQRIQYLEIVLRQLSQPTS